MPALAKKELFGIPSLETVGRIDDSDNMSAFQAAHYRLTAKMRQLECEFEVKAAQLRSAFVAECSEIVTEATE